jgi:hypothetical protein
MMPALLKTLPLIKKTLKKGRSNLDWFYGDSLDISYSSFGGWIPFDQNEL